MKKIAFPIMTIAAVLFMSGCKQNTEQTFLPLVLNSEGGVVTSQDEESVPSVPSVPDSSSCNLLPTALSVYGQQGDLTANTANNGGLSENSLNTPFAVAADSSGGLYVSDTTNHRVLYYPSGYTTATKVYGQANFTSNTAANPPTSGSLNFPHGIATDSSGGLYVADGSNNRVLYYPSGSTTASRVYGQGGDFTTKLANNGGISADSLNAPRAVAADSSGGLYIADYSNHRVLYYPSGSTTATRVYGQGGDFAANSLNNGGRSADSLNNPRGVAVDGSGGLYVADYNNNRVLYYPSGSTTATRVYGQANFTILTADTTADSLVDPTGVAADSSGGLYVADTTNNRVLYYQSGSTTASRVYGQLDFTTSAAASPPTANSLKGPTGLALNTNGGLYIADYSNNRVLRYICW